ncbi:MAG: metal ABC transporter permease [candidate division Zixibacteria bacterium]|nr:metal ABC transporter permease [candidate division Zixibacteria bacterium]
MTDFFHAIANYPFMLNALLAGLLASIACGVTGTYVVSRRITYLAGGLAHSVLGGMGVAYYLNVVHGWNWLHPLHGAIVAALLAAIVIGLVSLYSKEREDTAIGAVWAIGMAVGIVFISQTPGYSQDLMSYLFGNILMVGSGDLILIAILDALILITVALFFNQFQAVCFDQEFARIRGVNVELFYLLLLGLTALTVVILTTVVGIVMVIALLALPAAVAMRFTRTLFQTMLLGVILSALFSTIGLGLSYTPDLPAGATIILVAGATYVLVAFGDSILNRLRK